VTFALDEDLASSQLHKKKPAFLRLELGRGSVNDGGRQRIHRRTSPARAFWAANLLEPGTVGQDASDSTRNEKEESSCGRGSSRKRLRGHSRSSISRPLCRRRRDIGSGSQIGPKAADRFAVEMSGPSATPHWAIPIRDRRRRPRGAWDQERARKRKLQVSSILPPCAVCAFEASAREVLQLWIASCVIAKSSWVAGANEWRNLTVGDACRARGSYLSRTKPVHSRHLSIVAPPTKQRK
jgi:hypothetical protein